ncbi:hypothetical protein ABK040_003354 [Willaertia magna]
MSSLRSEVLKSYLLLLRARSYAFRGDSRMLTLSKRQIRQEFERNKFEKDEGRIKDLIKQANEAASFITLQIVQGVKEEQPTIEENNNSTESKVNEEKNKEQTEELQNPEGYRLRLNKKQVEANLDSSVTIKGIEEQISSIERRESRKRPKPTTTSEEQQETNKEQ